MLEPTLRIRPLLVTGLIVGAALGAGIGVASAVATPTCTDSWTGPVTGTTSWNSSPTNWSAGAFPTPSDVVCIKAAGTYTVNLPSGGASIRSLQLGGAASGTQTLTVDSGAGSATLALSDASTVQTGGVLTLASSTSGYSQLSDSTGRGKGALTIASGGRLSTSGAAGTQPALIEVPVTNNGTVSAGAADTRQDLSTATVNNGTFTVGSAGAYVVTAGSFTQAAGSETGKAVILSGGSLIDTAGTGAFTFQGNYGSASAFSGTIPAGQTVKVDASLGIAQITVDDAVTVNGTLSLSSTVDNYAMLRDVSSDATGVVTVASGGKLTTSGASGTQPVYIEAPLTNATGGTVSIGAADTRQDQATTTVNNGAFNVSTSAGYTLFGGSFTQSGGSAGTYTSSGSATGKPVSISGGTLNDSAGTGAFTFLGNNASTSRFTGSIPVGQTVKVDASLGVASVSVSDPITVAGTLTLTSTADNSALLQDTSDDHSSVVTVASGGKLTTAGTAGTQPVYIEAPITNASGGTVSIGAADTRQDQPTSTINNGTFTVGSSAAYLVSAGTFSQAGGSETGNAVTISGGSLKDTAGTGAFTFRGTSNSTSKLSGNIPTGQTVKIDATGSTTWLNLSAPLTVNGTLTLAPSTDSAAILRDASGANTATVTVASGGKLTTTGATGTQPAFIEVPLKNLAGGTVSIGAADTRQDLSTATVNNGTFTVGSTGAYLVSGGTFTQAGGSETGSAVTLSGGSLKDIAGTGAFTFKGNYNNASSFSGTIPTGQTVKVDASAGQAQISIAKPITVNGTLSLTSTTDNLAVLRDVSTDHGALVTVASGGKLTTSGGSGTQPVFLQAPITNASGGTVTIGASDTQQNANTDIVNDGTFTVSNGGKLSLNGGGSFTNDPGSVLGVTVNGTSGTGGINASGSELDIDGTLQVTTTGTAPAVGKSFTPITGISSGTFAGYNFGSTTAYSVTYSAGSLKLVVKAPSTVTSTPFSPHQNIPTGSVQVATIGNASASGFYSATVDWGDGSAAQPATVAISGSTGTVTAPTHTYTAAGSFTVTTTVVNNGATIVTTQTVTVPALKVTAISPTKGPAAGGTTVTVTGTGFIGATQVAFGATPGTAVTVTSDTSLTVTSPATTAGVMDVTVTTPAGTSATSSATKFTSVAAPAVTGISPSAGRTAGSTAVTVVGTALAGASVWFGSVQGTSVVVNSAGTSLTVRTPSSPAAGTVDVTVITDGGTSATTSADTFTYVAKPTVRSVAPSSGTTMGGTVVTVTGSNLTGATSVLFGATAGTAVSVNSSGTSLTVTSPASSAGAVDITVVTAGGTSSTSTADTYTYS